MSVKYLISGLPNSGKTTLLKDLKNAYVVAVDGKKYPFEQPHTNIDEFENIEELIDLVSEKIDSYEEKFKQLPDTVVFDSVSRIFMLIIDNCNNKYQGFTVWSEANKQIHKFVNFVTEISNANMNIVLVSHAIYDENTGKYSEVSQGNFGKTGGFLSTVDYASFIEIKSNKRLMHHRNPKFMARTLLEDMPDQQPVSEYNIQEYLDKIKAISSKAEKWVL